MERDKQYFGTIQQDIYDSNMKLWKIIFGVSTPAPFRSYSPQAGMGGGLGEVWDVQNDHAVI